jgi:hypothetical protein
MIFLNTIRDYADTHPKIIDYAAAGACMLCLISVLVMELADLRRKHLERNDRLFQPGVQTTIISAKKTPVVL